MRIVVNDIAATENSGGGYTILADFIDEVVLSKAENIEWIFLVGDSSYKKKHVNDKKVKFIVKEEIKRSWIKRLIFEFLTGNKFINKLNPDIYISLQNTPTRGVKAKQLVYFHQIIPFQETIKFNFFKKKERLFWIYQHLGKLIYITLFRLTNATIIVQSEWLKKILQINLENKILVVSPIIKLPSNISKNSFALMKNKFFFPASNFKYKNHKIILDAIDVLKERRIEDFEVIFTLDKSVERENSEIVNYIGNVSRKKVLEMLQSSILIFPSVLESYGLPLLEAKLIGSYILAPKLEYAKETLNGYRNVSYFDPFNSIELANIMERLISEGIEDEKYSEELGKQKSLMEIVIGEING